MTEYAPAPTDAPPMDGPDDLELAAHDAEYQAAMAEIHHNEEVAKRMSTLRVDQEARARLRAEKATDTNFEAAYLDRAGLDNLPAPSPLIADVLPRHGYVILRGRDHSFKSFAAIDWALCLATGKRWQDHHTEQVPVLYIAGEGAHGLSGRVDAWEYAWQTKVPNDMFTVRAGAPNMHQPGPAFDHLLEHVRERGYGLVVIDTLRRVSGAADGNGSEMGAVVDNIDLIKQATHSGSVLTIAHTDKGDHDTRGYSGIEDDADVVWAAKRDDNFLTLQLTKFKDGADGRTINLVAQPTIGSLVLAGTTGTPEVNTTESQAAILAALRVMPDGGVTGPDLMATAELKKPTFYRALDELIASQQVIRTTVGRSKYYELPGLLDADDTHPTATPAPAADDQPTLDQEDHK